MEEKYYIEAVTRCTRCPDMCACSCPVFTVVKNQSVSPSNKAHVAQMLATGLLDPSPTVAEILYQCNNCRLCAEWCIYEDLVLGDLLKESRSRLFQNAPDTLPKYVLRLRGLLEEQRSFHSDPTAAPEIREQLLHFIRERGEILIYEGSYLRAYQPEISLAALQLLQKLDITPVYLPDREPPCGAEADLLGFQDAALRSAEQVSVFLDEVGVGLVIALDPLCAYQLDEGFSCLGEDQPVQVKSFPEYMVGLLDERKPAFKEFVGLEVVVDDDPVLARYLNQADLPLQVLESIPGVRVLQCTPYGRMADPAVSYAPLPDHNNEAKITALKLTQLTSTGADTVITTSGRAKNALSEGIDDSPQVIHLAEFLLSALN